MTIRITSVPARTLVLTALAASLAGCGMISSIIDADKVDYKAARKQQGLEVPPDLTQLAKDNRYAVPDGKGVATASSLQQQPGATAPVAAGDQVGQVNTPNVRIEKAGSQRWLVVRATPETLWPVLKEFWHDNGFNLAVEDQKTGVLETEWNENRAKLPQDFIRNTVGKVFDGLYSTGERDKYRTRLERNADGTTEVFISHRGVEEVYSGPQKETTVWQPRATDPGLEAIFLTRLMARLENRDVKEVRPVAQTALNAPAVLHAKLVGDAVEVDEGYDRAWRRVGLALDRKGFTVEDRDRVQGVYFVRYVDPEGVKKDGFFSKIFGDSDKDKQAQRYRVQVKAEAGASVSRVTVLDAEGKPEKGPTGAKILNLLTDELK
ncbi:outer membrane protein assembly factor BamC [Massilia arenosa]|uniref:Outer membrane protein assembly factor BamC n=1 Tax=Zemynaea arenosa TaxID=2561931 RepID=A0A4Y9SQ77_9BURK|nr:outer membrane protein assembly factor BamC [Massilia arenosa]TFW27509.1 outer membrane protein assembly factor BamC [Massilia arenosa]